MKKLILGVGLNDSSYPTKIEKIISGNRKTVWKCPIFQAWENMLYRCYSSRFHSRYPTYIGCKVSDKWLRFSEFRAWMIQQDWEGRQLDKDILVEGNKLYSEELCVFVSSKLNHFLIDCKATRGSLPIGVNWDKRDRKYRAQCNNPITGKKESLGYFLDPGDAHKAWKRRKHEIACRYADMEEDERLSKALRIRYA